MVTMSSRCFRWRLVFDVVKVLFLFCGLPMRLRCKRIRLARSIAGVASSSKREDLSFGPMPDLPWRFVLSAEDHGLSPPLKPLLMEANCMVETSCAVFLGFVLLENACSCALLRWLVGTRGISLRWSILSSLPLMSVVLRNGSCSCSMLVGSVLV